MLLFVWTALPEYAAADIVPDVQETRVSPFEARTPRLPPLEQLITSPFGRRHMPGWRSRRGRVIRDHLGLDIRARLGWPVIAFKDGVVTWAGEHGLSGIMVKIRQKDGMTARYAHLGKALAHRGQQVDSGAVVGLVGCTGRTTGAHLHFALQDAKGVFIDPLPHLQSAEQLLRPAPEQIPARIEPQQCRPVLRRGLMPPPPRSSDINDF